jgi:hypothetical protein
MRSLATASSSATTTMSNGHSRSLSVKTNTKPRAVNAPPVSDIRLFVTNLRLLDLDLRDDWPGITVQTYSGKNADQKQRISSTEWALFRLFEVWDAEETAQVCMLIYIHYVTDMFSEITTLFSTPRTAPVCQPPCCIIPMSQ